MNKIFAMIHTTINKNKECVSWQLILKKARQKKIL